MAADTRGFKDLSGFESKRKDVPKKLQYAHFFSRANLRNILWHAIYRFFSFRSHSFATMCWTLFWHRHWFFGLTQVLGDGSWEKSVQQKTGARVIVPSKEIATLKLRTVRVSFPLCTCIISQVRRDALKCQLELCGQPEQAGKFNSQECSGKWTSNWTSYGVGGGSRIFL